MKSIIVYESGEIKEINPLNGKKFGLRELQGYVGGYIEMVGTKSGQVMVVNENGKIDGKCMPNLKATTMIIYEDLIYGNVVVCDNSLI